MSASDKKPCFVIAQMRTIVVELASPEPATKELGRQVDQLMKQGRMRQTPIELLP